MKKTNRWSKTFGWMILVGCTALPTIAGVASAQTPTPAASHRGGFSGGRSGGGWLGQLNQSVGLTLEQREAIQGLMAQQREQRNALYAGTNAKIRGLLNAQQQAKFDDFIAEQKNRRGRPQR